MKYYDAHDWEYKRRLKAGQVAWDAGEYEDFDMLPLIQRFLAESEFDASSPRSLDLGCGTGALPVFLASQGFDATAVEISQAAIDQAMKQAASRNAEVQFQVADIWHLDLPDESFDLITDNHFLHCIVFEDERKQVLGKIREMLKPGGQYWIETMVGHPAMAPRPQWNLDPEGITWAVISQDHAVKGCVEKNGETLLPIRRIRHSSEVLAQELRTAGFEILWQETAAPLDKNDTGTFRARCCK